MAPQWLPGSGRESQVPFMKGNFIRNVSWVLWGNLVHAVFQFLLNLLAARAFLAEEYGLLQYGGAVVSFFASVGTLGFSGVITRFFAEDRENAGTWLGTALGARLVFALAAVGAIQLLFYEAEPRLRLLLLCQSAAIVFRAGDGLVFWYRFQEDAGKAALYRMGAFFLCALWRLWAIFGAGSLVLYAAGMSAETLVFTVGLFLAYRREFSGYRFRFRREALKRMLSQSYPFISSAILVTVYAQTDKLMLEALSGPAAVGLYSVAVTLAGAISILPSALIEGFRPEILLRRTSDYPGYVRRLQQLYGLIFWLCMAYCLFVTVFSGPLIRLLYGSTYAAAAPALSIVVWYTSFSYFGSVNNLYMVSQSKTKWVQILTLAGAILNVVLNTWLIPLWGISGAALASLVTQFVTNFVLLFCIPPLREAFRILLQGIALRGFLPPPKNGLS